MKQNILTITVLLFGLLQLTPCTAQDGKRAEKVNQLRIAMISNALNMDANTATKFWPVYNKYADAKKVIAKDRKEAMKVLENAMGQTDADVDKALNVVINSAQRLADLQQQYKTEFLRVINIKQLATLYTTEKDFKEMLVQKMRGNMGRMRNGMDNWRSRGNMRRGNRQEPPPPPPGDRN